MNNKEVLLESLRISGGLIMSVLLLFLLKHFDLMPIANEYYFLLDWFGIIATISLFISYITAIIFLKREDIRRVNYRDSKIYIYGIVFTVSLYLILIVYFG